MKPRIRHTLITITAILLLILLVGSFVTSRGVEDFRVLPYRTQIHVRGDAKSAFLSDEEVFRLLPFKSTDSTAIAVRPHELESLLTAQSTYIRRAEVYVSPSSRALNVRVDERHPILTFYRGDQSYYLDSEGKEIVNRVGTSAYVPVAVGNLSPEIIQSTLFPIAQFLQKESKWTHFFGLIDVQSESCIQLYPRVGDFIFELQGIETIAEDMGKIPVFYKDIVPKVGSDKYKLIKLSYKNQIVCRKRLDDSVKKE